jgi:DNA integrity scanning protein DisA with diadenylate cyclase activity
MEVFKKSEAKLPVSLKIKTVELILNLMRDEKNFGLFVVLGWHDQWQEFTDISDSTQDIFVRHHINVADIENHADWYREVESTVGFDGAILIDDNGEIVHSGVMIEGLRPRIAAAEINPGNFSDLSDQFSFKRKVHTRHLSAITASYIFKNTTVFTVSEEANDMHIFEAGRIIYSIP